MVAAAAGIAVALVASPSAQAVERVRRKHAERPAPQYSGLSSTPELHPAMPEHGYPLAVVPLSKRKAEKDLDQLEWLIEHTYSYRDLRGVDYRAALDTIRCSLPERVRCGELACQLTKLIALFGDGHSSVRNPGLAALCSAYLPILVDESERGLVAFKPDRSGFLQSGLPFIEAVDGVPMETWLEAASPWCANGSPQLVRQRSIRMLRYINLLRQELGLEVRETVSVTLVSVDGTRRESLELPLASTKPVYGAWPNGENRLLPGNIGYLRIPIMRSRPEFLDSLAHSMHKFRETAGLIIDVRGNGGGSRAALHRLLPFFMASDDPPRVVNVAAYRLGVPGREEAFRRRYLRPTPFPGWPDEERMAVLAFAAAFQPEWTPPRDQFSEWHYFVIGPSRDEEYYHYDKPVVVLMDSVCFSATDIFLGAFKGWRNVTLMGTPSGGGSGCAVSTRLKHSNITNTP